jgi:hypothetical protein
MARFTWLGYSVMTCDSLNSFLTSHAHALQSIVNWRSLDERTSETEDGSMAVRKKKAAKASGAKKAGKKRRKKAAKVAAPEVAAPAPARKAKKKRKKKA